MQDDARLKVRVSGDKEGIYRVLDHLQKGFLLYGLSKLMPNQHKETFHVFVDLVPKGDDH